MSRLAAAWGSMFRMRLSASPPRPRRRRFGDAALAATPLPPESDDLEAQLAALEGKSDYFSRKEAARLRRLLGVES